MYRSIPAGTMYVEAINVYTDNTGAPIAGWFMLDLFCGTPPGSLNYPNGYRMLLRPNGEQDFPEFISSLPVTTDVPALRRKQRSDDIEADGTPRLSVLHTRSASRQRSVRVGPGSYW
jgi:hypothetical protein